MNVRSLLALFVLEITVSQCRNITGDAVEKVAVDQKRDADKSSLVFVFDTTGSMYDDLRQLREGAELILNAALEENSNIEDFVFVPFHDPDVGPATVTQDKQVFKNALSSVDVHGGMDCPEMSLGGVLLALETSRPKSQVYVFTDATAKDHYKLAEVLDKLQQTQSQVVFVLTGHCNDLRRPSYQAYQKVTAASSGQVFNLNKTSVHNVLDFVRNSLKGRRVNLGSRINSAGYNHTQNVPIDNTLDEVTVSVSGVKPQIRVVDPGGNELTGPPKLIRALDLSEIMIIKVIQPKPGNWSITVGSEDDHSVKVVGLSNLTFSHGFSVEMPENIVDTSYRPLQGTYNHLLIHLTGPTTNVKLKYAEILDLDGKTLFEVPLHDFDTSHNVYIADAFLPPDELFYIAVNGFDELGQELRRVGSTAVQSKLPDAPQLKTSQKIEAQIHDSIILECKVESLVPFSAMWMRDGRKIQDQKTSLQTTSIFYTISDLKEQNEGIYTCFAKNVAGVSTSETKIIVLVDPPQVTIQPENITSLPGDDVIVFCTVYSDVSLSGFELSFNGSNGHQYAVDIAPTVNPDGLYVYNKTLQRVSEANQGTYTCSASNRGGQTIKSTYISILAKPTVQILGPHTIAQNINTGVQIVCKIENADKVVWKEKDRVIKEEALSYNMSMLEVNVTKDTVVTCVGARGLNQASDKINIVALIKPQVMIRGAKNMTLFDGENAQVTCDVIAKPPPRIVWHKETEVFLYHTIFELSPTHFRSVITINSTDDKVNRTYFCIGENSEGIGMDGIEVFFRRKMKLLEGFTDKTVEIYSQVEFKCVVDSYPEPKITWYHNGTILEPHGNRFNENATVLSIHKVDFKDTGEYVCEANNGFEKLTANGTLMLTGLEAPLLMKVPVTILVRKGERAVLACRVLKGRPNALLSWSNDNKAPNSQVTINSDDISYNLTIANVTIEHQGIYKCLAENIVGKDFYNVSLNVQSPPEIVVLDEKNVDRNVKVQSGGTVVLSCLATGNPEPQVIWFFERQPVIYSDKRFVNGLYKLTINNVTQYDTGTYYCLANNVWGSQSTNFTIQVYERPQIIPATIKPNIEVLEGHLVELPCLVKGTPRPNVTWFHNGVIVHSRGKYIDDFGIRFVANLTDFGEHTCLARNEFGNTSMSYNVSVWVPPSIQPPLSTKANAVLGSKVTLSCDAVGFPVPTLLWEFEGKMLMKNTSSISFDHIGNLYINPVLPQNEGLYACVAENIAGVATKWIYLNVQEPPKIVAEDFEGPYLAMNMDKSLVVPCNASGKPKPYVFWSKDGFYLSNDDHYDIATDGKLIIKRPTEELSGEYTCHATNILGSVEKTVTVQIYTLPTTGKESITIKVVEGTNVSLPCPLQSPHNATVKWYKDAKLISHGNLSFTNITRYNASSYACVINTAVYTLSSVLDLVVEWPPELYNDESSTKRVLRGEDVSLDCGNDAKPLATITWYFNMSKIQNEDKKLKLKDVQSNQSGIYKCVVNNPIGRIEREYQLTVLVPPFVSDFDMLDVDLQVGTNASLECVARGSPKPIVTWSFNNTNWKIINNSLVSNITINSEGIFRCDATNKAGKSYIVYRVNVLSDAKITQIVMFQGGKGINIEENIDVKAGNRIRLACYVTGRPTPEIKWLRNGITYSTNKPMDTKTTHQNENNSEIDVILYADLVIDDVQSVASGKYVCAAANQLGMDEKKVFINVLEPPKIQIPFAANSTNSTKIEIISGQAFYLTCHAIGNPIPSLYWFKNGVPLRFYDKTMTSSVFGEIVMSPKGLVEQAGNYTCVARNSVGNTSFGYIVDVLVPPPLLKENHKIVTTRVSKTLNLTCPVIGIPVPIVTWIKQPYSELKNSDRIMFINDNQTLIISKTQTSDSGYYSCITTNRVGSNEFVFRVVVEQTPSIAGNVGGRNVESHVVPWKRSVVLKCEVEGHPAPKITWLKDTQPIPETSPHIQNFGTSSVFVIWSVEVTHASRYICLAENNAGVAHRRYNVVVKVPGKYSGWSEWSLCNVTCGLGYQHRNRTCHFIDDYNNTIEGETISDKIVVDTATCVGSSVGRRKCLLPPCEEESQQWGAWSEWGECSASCGDGTVSRWRTCRARVRCRGDNIQLKKCSKPCNDHFSDESLTYNEVTNGDDEKDNPYLPEVTLEMGPDSNVPQDVEDIDNSFESKYLPSFFEVNMTQNLIGASKGPCGVGYKYNSVDKSCQDIDECQLRKNHCHVTQVCVNTIGGYKCGCDLGYKSLGVGKRCLDINECALEIHGCEVSCVNTAGGYVCACPTHTRLHADKRSCVLLNEGAD